MCHNYQTISEAFGECRWMGQGVATDRRASCFSTDKQFSLLPRSSPLQLTHVSLALLLSPVTLPHLPYTCTCSPVSNSSNLSPSPQAQQLQFPHWLHNWFPSLSSRLLVTSRRSPANKSHCYRPDHLCFPRPKWGLRLIPGKFQPN